MKKKNDMWFSPCVFSEYICLSVDFLPYHFHIFPSYTVHTIHSTYGGAVPRRKLIPEGEANNHQKEKVSQGNFTTFARFVSYSFILFHSHSNHSFSGFLNLMFILRGFGFWCKPDVSVCKFISLFCGGVWNKILCQLCSVCLSKQYYHHHFDCQENKVT